MIKGAVSNTPETMLGKDAPDEVFPLDRPKSAGKRVLSDVMEELRSAETWRGGATEFIATGLFVFLGAGAVVVTGQLTDGVLTPARLVAIALAHGLAIMLLVAATANVSGGHINPAVTLAAMITRNLSVLRSVIYIAAQITGAIFGALLIAAVVPGAIDGALGSHALSVDINQWSAVLAEMLFSFVLVFVVLSTAMNPKPESTEGRPWGQPLKKPAGAPLNLG